MCCLFFFPKENQYKEQKMQTSHNLKCVFIIAKIIWEVSLDLVNFFIIYGSF